MSANSTRKVHHRSALHRLAGRAPDLVGYELETEAGRETAATSGARPGTGNWRVACAKMDSEANGAGKLRSQGGHDRAPGPATKIAISRIS